MNRVMVLLLSLMLLIPVTVNASDTVSIRDYLIGKGYTNEQITYDSDREMVRVNGRDFYGTSPREDGRTYGSLEYLDKLIDKHQKGDYMIVMDPPKTRIE